MSDKNEFIIDYGKEIDPQLIGTKTPIYFIIIICIIIIISSIICYLFKIYKNTLLNKNINNYNKINNCSLNNLENNSCNLQIDTKLNNKIQSENEKCNIKSEDAIKKIVKLSMKNIEQNLQLQINEINEINTNKNTIYKSCTNSFIKATKSNNSFSEICNIISNIPDEFKNKNVCKNNSPFNLNYNISQICNDNNLTSENIKNIIIEYTISDFLKSKKNREYLREYNNLSSEDKDIILIKFMNILKYKITQISKLRHQKLNNKQLDSDNNSDSDSDSNYESDSDSDDE